MSADVLRHSVTESRRSLVGWGLGWVAMMAMYIALWPAMEDNGQNYNDIMENFPEELQNLFTASGSVIDFTTAAGYMTVELMSFMGPALVLVWAILAGSRAIAGDEEQGTLELVMSVPITRRRLVVEKLLGFVAQLTALMAVVFACLVVGSPLVDLGFSLGDSFAMAASFWMLGLEFGVLALALGAATGSTAVAKGVPALLAVGSYLLYGLGPTWDLLDGPHKISPFYAYLGHDPLVNGLSLTGSAAMIGVSVVLAVAAVVLFRRRDVA